MSQPTTAPPEQVVHNADCAAYKPAYRCPTCMRQYIATLEHTNGELARNSAMLVHALQDAEGRERRLQAVLNLARVSLQVLNDQRALEALAKAEMEAAP